LENDNDAEARCAAAVAALSTERNWRLDAGEQRSYVAALIAYLPERSDVAALRRMVESYHDDHRLVRALREASHPRHDAAWTQWSAQAMRIAQRHAAGAQDDASIDVHDLAQLALEEIMQALHSYRYASRFSTWAYAVISRRVQRHIRDSRAAKRAVRPESLDLHDQAGPMFAERVSIDAPVEAGTLLELVLSVLTRRADERQAQIFYLWAVEEQRLAQIGQQVQLSASRVSILIEQARQTLRSAPELLAWIGQSDVAEGRGSRAMDGARTQKSARFVTNKGEDTVVVGGDGA